MAARLAPPSSEFVLKLPPPTEKELAEVTVLKAEREELLQKRSSYIGILNALYGELQQAFVADRALHQEVDDLTAVLQGLGFVCQSSWDATAGGSVENINDFILHILDGGKDSIAQFDEEPEVMDLEPSMLGDESALSANAVQVMGAGWIDTVASKLTFTACTPVADTTHCCATSAVPGMFSEPASYEKYPKNIQPHSQLASLDQQLMPRPASAPVTFPKPTPPLAEAVTGTLEPTPSSTRDLIQQTQVQMSGSVPLVEGDLLQDTGVEGLLSVDTARCNFSLHQPGVGACGLSQDVIQQFVSHIPTNCPCTNAATGSMLATFNHQHANSSNTREEDSSACAEQHRRFQAPQPDNAALELNGLASCPIACGLTTLVIRNVPSRYTKENLLHLWPPDGTFDFLYLPFNRKQRRTAGYLFMNFTSHDAAVAFYKKWHGKQLHDQGTARKLSIRAAEIQGLEENLRHLIDANVHQNTNPKYLPIVFSGVDEFLFTELVEQMAKGRTSERILQDAGVSRPPVFNYQ